MGRRRGVPEREGCLLLQESTFHQQIYNSGGFFPGWMHQLVPYACDGSDLGCQALVPMQLRGVSARGHELRSPPVPGFAELVLGWLLAAAATERETIHKRPAIKQPPNCSATRGSSAAF